MKERIEIKLFLLQAIDACSGEPMPRTALVQQTQLALTHRRLADADIEAGIDALVAQRLAVETRDDITEQRLYTLTTKGQAAVNSHRG